MVDNAFQYDKVSTSRYQSPKRTLKWLNWIYNNYNVSVSCFILHLSPL